MRLFEVYEQYLVVAEISAIYEAELFTLIKWLSGFESREQIESARITAEQERETEDKAAELERAAHIAKERAARAIRTAKIEAAGLVPVTLSKDLPAGKYYRLYANDSLLSLEIKAGGLFKMSFRPFERDFKIKGPKFRELSHNGSAELKAVYHYQDIKNLLALVE